MGRLAFSRLQSNMNPSPSGEAESLNLQLSTWCGSPITDPDSVAIEARRQ